MAIHAHHSPTDLAEPKLPADFAERLERSLREADRERRRQMWLARARRALLLTLLVGPFVGWRLTLSAPSGLHLYIDVLSWLAFMLDAAVHVDASVLRYLGLQALPAVTGCLLFAMVTLTLLWTDDTP
ncbi:MAG TPA: hypothetical protein VKX16_16285 [Chloroflexota bacterium]|nr:hypothetical protein [Chloroflexota bacterium]